MAAAAPAQEAPTAPAPNPSVNSSATLLDRMSVAVEDEVDESARRLSAEENVAVLDAALEAIFGGDPPESAEAQVLRILQYVPQVTRNEFLGAPSGSACLEAGHGICTDMAQAFVALVRRQGLPARVNSLFNLEIMQGHNTAEVHYDGAWHFFDPTYATFFYTQAEYDQEGRIPDLREIAVYPSLRQHCFVLTDTLWRGEYGPVEQPRLLESGRAISEGVDLRSFYELLFAKGFPLLRSQEDAAVFPIVLDAMKTGEAWIGSPDDSTMDVEGTRHGGKYLRYRGRAQFGEARDGHAAHHLILRAPAPGLYRLTYHFTQPRFGEVRVVELQDVLVGRQASEGTTWHADLRIQQPGARLLVYKQSGKAYVDAIHLAPLADAGVE